MLNFISGVEKRKIKFFIQKIAEKFKLKDHFYKIIIKPSQLIALYKIRKISKNTKEKTSIKNGKKIIFNSIDARYMIHTYTEAGLAKALEMRGHDVKMLICDGIFKTCVGHYNIKKPPTKWRCENCKKFSKKFYKEANVKFSPYREYISNERIKKIREKVKKLSYKECLEQIYKEVEVGFNAKTSADRYFVGLEPDKKTYEYMLREELVNSIITTDVAEEVVKRDKPDILVTSHGCYSHWGSFSDYFLKNGIKVHVWFTGYKGNTITFDKHLINQQFKSYYESIRNKKALNGNEEKTLDEFLKRRMKGKEGDTAFYEFSNGNKDLEKKFEIEKYDSNYFIFPNVPWDRSILFLDEKVAFKDVYKWISYTIELFKKQKNKQLVIKIHPAESKTNKSEKTMLDYILEKHKKLPNNIKIIPPDTDISPYSFFKMMDVGIVCNGTIGLEMAVQNIPVIVTGNVHYSKKGFTHDVVSPEEYLKKIENNILPLNNQQKLAKIYAYFFFIKSFIPRKFIYYRNFLNLGWDISSFDDLSVGKDKHLDHLCECISTDKLYQDW